MDFVIVCKNGHHVCLVAEAGEHSAAEWHQLLTAQAAQGVEREQAAVSSPTSANTTDSESKEELPTPAPAASAAPAATGYAARSTRKSDLEKFSVVCRADLAFRFPHLQHTPCRSRRGQ